MGKFKLFFGGLLVFGFAISCNCDDSSVDDDLGRSAINELVHVIGNNL